jgi:hypothetical protein
MRRYWVFTIGTRDLAPPVDWLASWPQHVDQMWFPRTKRPVSVSRGDRAVIYGSQGRGFIGAVEVLSSEPEPNESPESGARRYPWILRYRLLAAKAADDNVAHPEAAGIATRRVQRGPHTKIEEEEYQRAAAAVLEAAAGSVR